MPKRPAPKRDVPSKTGWRAYHRATRSATYGFLAALPLVLAYEVLIGVANTMRPVGRPVRLGAEVWLKGLLPAPAGWGLVVMLAAIAVVGVAVFYWERGRRVPLRPRYFAFIAVESALYALFVAAVVSNAVAVLFAAGVPPLVAGPAAQQASGMLAQMALSIGAGVYEELLFRVLLVGGLALLFRRVLAQKRYAYLAAAVVGALLFSAAHYTGLYGDVLSAPSFVFRFLFGLALNAIFLARGFAVAAWTHALYDVMIVTRLLG